MAQKFVLSAKNAHLIVHRLRQFCDRHDYIQFQRHYKRKPMCSEENRILSAFYAVEKSLPNTKGGPCKVTIEDFDSIVFNKTKKLLCISHEEYDCRIVFHYGDTFQFSPTHIKVRVKRPSAFGPNAERCTEIISRGTYEGYRKSLQDQEESRCYAEEYFDDYWEREMDMMMSEGDDQF